MTPRIIALALAAAAALATPAAAQASSNPYRTTNEAKQYLETGLPAWADVNLTAAKFKSASCSTGAYSDYETRTHRHFKGRVGRDGRRRYRSFDCDLYVRVLDGVDADGLELTHTEDFELYLQTRTGGWMVTADR